MQQLHKMFTRYGNLRYTIDEPCSILQHSLQTAYWVHCNTAGNPLATISGLLHDYGHVCKGVPVKPSTGLDDKHKIVGADELKKMGFPDAVTEPIRLHVLAKRYLFTKNPAYQLSKGSQLSFALQGGALTEKEMRTFERCKFFEQALLLRHADDKGKAIDSAVHQTKSIMDYSWLIKLVLDNK